MLNYSIARIGNFFKALLGQILYICFVKLCLQIAFVIIILGGSLGIPVYQHTCLNENRSEHAIFVNTTECHDNEEQHETMSCCQPAQSEKKADDGCCTDEVSAYKVSFFKQFHTEFQFSSLDFEDRFPQVVFSFPVHITEGSEVLAFADLPPPKLQKRLALIQVWRI
jgi:hypothetical protein